MFDPLSLARALVLIPVMILGTMAYSHVAHALASLIIPPPAFPKWPEGSPRVASPVLSRRELGALSRLSAPGRVQRKEGGALRASRGRPRRARGMAKPRMAGRPSPKPEIALTDTGHKPPVLQKDAIAPADRESPSQIWAQADASREGDGRSNVDTKPVVDVSGEPDGAASGGSEATSNAAATGTPENVSDLANESNAQPEVGRGDQAEQGASEETDDYMLHNHEGFDLRGQIAEMTPELEVGGRRQDEDGAMRKGDGPLRGEDATDRNDAIVEYEDAERQRAGSLESDASFLTVVEEGDEEEDAEEDDDESEGVFRPQSWGRSNLPDIAEDTGSWEDRGSSEGDGKSDATVPAGAPGQMDGEPDAVEVGKMNAAESAAADNASKNPLPAEQTQPPGAGQAMTGSANDRGERQGIGWQGAGRGLGRGIARPNTVLEGRPVSCDEFIVKK